jgi:hypothetical protein
MMVKIKFDDDIYNLGMLPNSKIVFHLGMLPNEICCLIKTVYMK